MRSARLWHQSVNELHQLDVYGRALSEHARAVLGDDATVDVHGLPGGTYGGLSATGALGNAFSIVCWSTRSRPSAMGTTPS